MILLLSNQNIIELVNRVINVFIFIRYNKLTIISLESRKLNHRLRASDLFSHVFFFFCGITMTIKCTLIFLILIKY